MKQPRKPKQQLSELDFEVRPFWAWTMRVSSVATVISFPFAILWQTTAFTWTSVGALVASGVVFLLAVAKARPTSDPTFEDGPWTLD